MLEPVPLDCPSASSAPSADRALAEAVDRIAARLRRGGRPEIEVELARNPECADALRMLWPTLEALAAARSGAHAATCSAQRVPLPSDSQAKDAAATHSVIASEHEMPAANPKSKIENPKSLGDFELLREVGRGGMGIVYEARQVSLGRRVAVKVLPAASLLDARQLQRFQNEARAAAQLNHPHIVDVISVGNDDGVHYFAMRFVEGRTLAELIALASGTRQCAGDTSDAADSHCKLQIAPKCAGGSQGKLQNDASESMLDSDNLRPKTQDLRPKPSGSNPKSKIQNPKSAEWIAQAAEALHHAHASGVVHRDVKPSNLLVDNDGKLWVTDFGVARFGDDAGLTLTGDLLGTLRYMSPEQALGRLSAIGPRSDVYSLGATLYELLASRPVFTGDDRGELLRQVAFEQPTALRKLDPRLPRDLETIAHKALEKSPEDRYATAGEMAADLRRYLRGEPIRAKPPTLAERTTKWCLRHRRIAVTAAVLLLLVVAGLLASTLLIAHSRNDALAAQKIAEDRYRESRRMLSVIETGLAMQAFQQGDLTRAKELLDQQGLREDGLPSPSRQPGNGDDLPLSPGEGRGEGGSRTMEDGLPSPSRPADDGLGRPSSEDDFRNFAWHWLRQSIDSRVSELKSFDGHPGEVYEVEYSPDGTLLAAACGNGHILLRDAKTGETLHDIAAHKSDVNALDFSRDGTLLASVGDDRRVRLWHVATAELTADFGEHDCQISSVAFSHDGRRLASGDEHGLIIVWDVTDRREEKRLVKHTDRVRKLAFAADGTLVSISADWYLTAWNVDEAGPRWRFAAPHTRFNAVALSPDDKTVAAGDGLGIVFLLDLADGRVLGRMGMRNRAVDSLAFSPDCRLLAAGGDDNRVQLWDLARQTCLGQTPTHGDRVWSVALSPDGRTLATGTRDRVVKLWEVESIEQPRRSFTSRAEIGIAFSDDSRALAVYSDGEAWLWPRGALRPRKLPLPAELNKLVHRGPQHSGGTFVASCVAWFSDELILQDATGSVWIAGSNGECRPWIKRQGAQARTYSLSPDRRWLALVTTEGITEIWDTSSAEFVGKTPVTRRVAIFSADSRSFYTCQNGRVLCWPLRLPTPGATLSGDKASIGAPAEIFRLQGDLDPVAASRDGRTLLLGFDQLLDLPSLRTTSLVGHETAINCAALSPDGRALAMGGMDGTVSLWDVGTAQEVCTLERRTDGEIGGIIFSPDGRSLAASGRDGAGGSVTLWELK
ncbi:MAG TPA: protein kinase [Pirellulales bacterium]|nr:protein kinase [Pirellulales bacterium]